MNTRTSIRYMKWVGEKMKAGDTLTEEEAQMFLEAEEASLSTIQKFMRLGPKDWEYTKGEPFK
jgi:hypothetical protein